MDEELWKLIRACKVAGKVKVTRQALISADLHFGLATEKDVLWFIADRGLENCVLKNRRPFENGAGEMVHAFRFRSGARRGYIAFYETTIWVIKSFKRDEDPEIPVRSPER
jgi:hypothetical protein